MKQQTTRYVVATAQQGGSRRGSPRWRRDAFSTFARFWSVLVGVSLALTAQADWTVSLPQDPTNPYTRAEPSAESGFGVLVWLGDAKNGMGRGVAWYSPEGELQLHHSWDADFFTERARLRFVNARQVVVYPPISGKALLLLTLQGDGKFTVRKYQFSLSQYIWAWAPADPPTDPNGFYYTDTATWTLTRTDFPKPEEGLKTVELQSGTEAAGPWTTIERFTLPANKPQEFFRLSVQ